MSASNRSLPLGIDIGRRRVRVALADQASRSRTRLLAVAGRDHAGDIAAALRDALAELQTRERRCVVALGVPDAVLCTANLPAMTPWERAAAARFEASRFIDYPIADATVSLARTDAEGCWAIGIVRRSSLTATLDALNAAGLRPLAVDDAALALRRAHPDADGVIDVGDDATRVTVFGQTVPYAARVPIGGTRFTEDIAQSLGIDVPTAEERKREIGFGGAAEASRDAWLASLAHAFADARSSGYADVRTIVLCGNGSRIPGLETAIERATGHAVRTATLPSDCSDTIPADVLRAAAPDWSTAYGLCLWSTAS